MTLLGAAIAGTSIVGSAAAATRTAGVGTAAADSHQRLLKSARDELNLTHVRLRSGLDDRREVLASQDALLDQQYVLNGLEADHLLAIVDLIQALGGGYSNGIDSSRPHLEPEEALSGLEIKTPAWALDNLTPHVVLGKIGALCPIPLILDVWIKDNF
jgi:hypothetical protein